MLYPDYVTKVLTEGLKVSKSPMATSSCEDRRNVRVGGGREDAQIIDSLVEMFDHLSISNPACENLIHNSRSLLSLSQCLPLESQL